VFAFNPIARWKDLYVRVTHGQNWIRENRPSGIVGGGLWKRELIGQPVIIRGGA